VLQDEKDQFYGNSTFIFRKLIPWSMQDTAVLIVSINYTFLFCLYAYC